VLLESSLSLCREFLRGTGGLNRATQPSSPLSKSIIPILSPVPWVPLVWLVSTVVCFAFLWFLSLLFREKTHILSGSPYLKGSYHCSATKASSISKKNSLKQRLFPTLLLIWAWFLENYWVLLAKWLGHDSIIINQLETSPSLGIPEAEEGGKMTSCHYLHHHHHYHQSQRKCVIS